MPLDHTATEKPSLPPISSLPTCPTRSKEKPRRLTAPCQCTGSLAPYSGPRGGPAARGVTAAPGQQRPTAQAIGSTVA
eukprot:6750311-Alexandrium_andersonii.AAC.1